MERQRKINRNREGDEEGGGMVRITTRKTGERDDGITKEVEKEGDKKEKKKTECERKGRDI